MNAAKSYLETGETLDSTTNNVKTISQEHHEIHEGDGYKMWLNTTDLDSNALTITFKTPSTANKFIHLVVLLWSAGQAVYRLKEAPRSIAGGSVLNVFNRKRSSSNTTSIIATHTTVAGFATKGATVIGGTVIDFELFGTGKEKQAGQNRDELEWDLNSDTFYAIQMTSTTNSVIAQMTARFYEHTTSTV